MSQKKIKKVTKTKIVKQKVQGFWQQPKLYVPALLTLAFTAICFISSLDNHFVNWDDDVNILENPNLRAFDWPSIKGIFTGTVIGNYNPLTIFTFALEKHFFGIEEATIFHVNNLILHLICVFFVYRIMLLMGLSRVGAVIAALLFGIHPMRVESVAWVTERKDVLYGAFYLSALFTYIQFKHFNKGTKYLVWTIVLFALSLLSKIQAVAFPLSLIVIDYYFKQPIKLNPFFKELFDEISYLLSKVKKTLLRSKFYTHFLIYISRYTKALFIDKLFIIFINKWFYFVLSFIVGAIGVYFLSENNSLDDTVTKFNIFDRLLIGIYSYFTYLAKLVFPYEMSPLYPYPSKLDWVFKVAPALILPLGYGLYRAYIAKNRAVIFAFAFFTFNVMFVLQILGAGQGFIADRFTYIPYLGFFFLIAYYYDFLIKKIPSKKNYVNMGIAAYLLLFGVMTFQQNKIWKNGGTLWGHVLTCYNKALTPWTNRAHYYRDHGQTDKALADYSSAIKLKSSVPATYNSRGKLYFDLATKMPQKDRSKAIELCQKAITDYTKGLEMNPKDSEHGELLVNRGAAFGFINKFQRALDDLNKGIKFDPSNKNGYLNRSLLYFQSGEYELAIKDHDAYLVIDPYKINMYYERAIAKRSLGREQEALKDLNVAIKNAPNNGLFIYERAKVYVRLNQKEKAKQDALKAKELGFNVLDEFWQQLN